MSKMMKSWLLFLGMALVGNITNLEAKNDSVFTNMSCNELMIGLIKDSSFNKKFMDKSMSLEFYFERHDDKNIGLTFVRTSGKGKGIIYANFNLDLVNRP